MHRGYQLLVKQLEEAATLSDSNIRTRLKDLLCDALMPEEQTPGMYYPRPYVLDVFGDETGGQVVYEFDNHLMRCSYTGDGNAFTLGNDAREVTPRAVYDDAAETAGDPMSEGKRKPLRMEYELTESAAKPAAFNGFQKLSESAVGVDGTTKIKVISPGWGSSAYYPASILKRDGPSVFTPGLKMYWNHQTAMEEAERPEGDLNDFAAVLTTPAEWQDDPKNGPGLYAMARVNENYRKSVDDLAPYIGVSIRASGETTQGKAEGKSGPILQRLIAAKSIDFVTEPGAGGKVLQLFEAAGRTAQTEPKGENNVNEQQFNELKEAHAKTSADLAAAKERIKVMNERFAITEARRIAAGMVPARLPEITRNRIIESAVRGVQLTEAGELDKVKLEETVKAAVTEETNYLNSLTEGRSVSGFGGTVDSGAEAGDPAKLHESAVSGMERLGFSKVGAKAAMGVN